MEDELTTVFYNKGSHEVIAICDGMQDLGFFGENYNKSKVDYIFVDKDLRDTITTFNTKIINGKIVQPNQEE